MQTFCTIKNKFQKFFRSIRISFFMPNGLFSSWLPIFRKNIIRGCRE
nr:MAG TPA: hypothetical protein [Caudoviricetes sp.]